MAKADCVYITPPTNTSAIDDPQSPGQCNCLMCLAEGDNSPHRIRSAMGGAPSRRRFLAIAAVGSIAGAGSLAFAAAAPNDVPAAVTNASPNSVQRDPMFGMIEAHRKADRDHEAALDEQDRLEQIGDDAAADLAGEASCHAAFKAFDVLLAAPATTLPGIVAKLVYLQDIAHRGDAWTLTDRPDAAIHLLESFAASIANIRAVLS